MHLDFSVLLVDFSPFLTCTEFQTAFLLLSFAAWPLLLNLLLRPLFKSSAVSNLPLCPTLPLPIYLNISPIAQASLSHSSFPRFTKKSLMLFSSLSSTSVLCLPFPLVYLNHISFFFFFFLSYIAHLNSYQPDLGNYIVNLFGFLSSYSTSGKTQQVLLQMITMYVRFPVPYLTEHSARLHYSLWPSPQETLSS